MITLKTLPDATAQAVFDQGAMHILIQDEKSYLTEDQDDYQSCEPEQCAYRNSDGLQCSAGCFIADDEYDSNWERQGWDMLVKKQYVPRDHEYLIGDLQHVHDDYAIYRWAQKLISLATDHSVSATIVYDFLTTHPQQHRRVL